MLLTLMSAKIWARWKSRTKGNIEAHLVYQPSEITLYLIVVQILCRFPQSQSCRCGEFEYLDLVSPASRSIFSRASIQSDPTEQVPHAQVSGTLEIQINPLPNECTFPRGKCSIEGCKIAGSYGGYKGTKKPGERWIGCQELLRR